MKPSLSANAATIERELAADGVPVIVPMPRVCELLGISHRTAQRLIASGDLPAYRATPGGSSRVRIRRSEIARFFAAREQRAEPARA